MSSAWVQSHIHDSQSHGDLQACVIGSGVQGLTLRLLSVCRLPQEQPCPVLGAGPATTNVAAGHHEPLGGKIAKVL